MMNIIKKLVLYPYHHFWLNSHYYRWNVLAKQCNKAQYKELCRLYAERVDLKDVEPLKCVCCIYEGVVFQGGLADRLRGILSTYMVCKEYNIQFKLYFKHPFDLEMFFLPNQYDWHIEQNQITHDLSKVSFVIIDTTENSIYQSNRQMKTMRTLLHGFRLQTHVYTNANFCYQCDYSSLFHELFKLSPRLENKLHELKQHAGDHYLSISCRFLDLLGDFNESFGYGKPLSNEEKKELIAANINQIQLLHESHPNKKILVNSDSVTFLAAVQQLNYVFVNPGEVTHVDNTNSASYETFEKTFIDFLMIANAEHIYLQRTGRMMNSGYPYAASLIYNKPFTTINF